MPEHDVLSVAHEVGLLTFAATFNLYGLLTKRDDCAHPSEYRPGRTEALESVAELIRSMSNLTRPGGRHDWPS